MAAASINGSSASGQKSPNHPPQQEAAVMSTGSFIESARVMWNFFFNKPAGTVPTGAIPVRKMSREQLLAAPDNTVFRLGHSTVLLKLQHAFWLTDPVFSDRASPIPFAGPLRFHKPPISIEELPPIKGVIISHDHFDHLDRRSIVALAKKTEYFMTPPGVGDILTEWGVPSVKIRQLDWWQSIKIGGVLFAATPSQHFSGRGLFGRNKTQWGSWVMLSPGFRVFFSGDSGYFSGFKRIGDEYGPFDLTMLEAGAYNEHWAGVHMMPEETIQAHIDLKGKVLLPIHNGTFDLSMHRWQEPFERILHLAQTRSVRVSMPLMGEPVSAQEPDGARQWWTGVDPAGETDGVLVKGHATAPE